MKRFYFIFPLILMAAFSALYWQFSKTSEAAELVRQEELAKAKQEAELKKKADEARSREDSEKRIAARLAEEKKKEDERIAKWDAESKRIEDETQQYTTQIGNLTKESAALEKQLAELRATKEARTREVLSTATETELTAIAKRTAEMEIQRLTEMVARKAAGTSLVKQ